MLTLPDAPSRFHVLAKPTGATCNLDCAYCFFLSKEMLYPGSRFRMADELLETYIRQLIESHRANEVTIAWQGGEPTLMGLPFFLRSVEYAEKYRRPGMTIEYTMQTNGTLLDDEWGKFLAANRFLIGISIDGPREIHDLYRYDKGGAPTFDKVVRGLNVLKRYKVEWNILCTLHRNNADRPLEIYHFFRDELGAQFIQFIPIVERLTARQAAVSGDLGEPWHSWRDRPIYIQAGDLVTARSITAKQYGDFLSIIFDEWVRRDVGRVYVQMFDVALANWVGEPSGLCVHSRTCGGALAIEHNGDLYSCDHFVEPAYLLGNIQQDHMLELVASEKQQQFGRDKFDTLPRYCRECDVRFACHGGCPKDRFIKTPDGEDGLNYLCEGYKLFFHHIDEAMRFMGNELRHQRPPANIMKSIAQLETARREPFAHVGRNDVCPCGSGKKYKNCHGRRAR